MPDVKAKITRIEQLIRRDPANRGLLRDPKVQIGSGHLERAATSLANQGQHIGIATGFFVPTATPPAAETDGPPGAVTLGYALKTLGMQVSYFTDDRCGSELTSALTAAGERDPSIHIMATSDDVQVARDEILKDVTHLIAIERLGPSYSAVTPPPIHDRDNPDIQGALNRLPDQPRFFNMRGDAIDSWTTDFSPWFSPNSSAPYVTIGVGDGGNEIGMGSFDWWELIQSLPETSPPNIVTQTCCDHTVVAGVSNWGAVALAASVALCRNQIKSFAPITPQWHWNIIKQMVRDGAVDGVTKSRTVSVDGLSREAYLQPIEQMHDILFADHGASG